MKTIKVGTWLYAVDWMGNLDAMPIKRETNTLWVLKDGTKVRKSNLKSYSSVDYRAWQTEMPKKSND